MLYVYLCTDIITLDILYPILRHVICLLVYITLDILYPILRHVICLLVYRHITLDISYFKTCYMSTCVQTT